KSERWEMLMLQFGELLATFLGDESLQSLCHRLEVDYDELPGDEKANKAKELVAHLDRADRIPELLKAAYTSLVESPDTGIPAEVKEALTQFQNTSPEEFKRSLMPHDAARFECNYVYTIYGSGDVIVDTHVVPDGNLPPLPRIGLQMRLPGQYDNFTWYGRGPHETYADRKLGAKIGVYGGTVDEQYVPYVMPQENGNKTDVRWVALTNAAGIGLMAVGMPLLNVSAHHFTTQDLTQAIHTYELERRDSITLNLDYKQSGLGGASCGPGTLPQYLIEPREVRFSLRLRPISLQASSPLEVGKQVIERV
ncbi:MAG: hypothetical protein V3S14_13440, partial [Anaerolineae bacterium]